MPISSGLGRTDRRIAWDLESTFRTNGGFGNVPRWTEVPEDCSLTYPVRGGENIATAPGYDRAFRAIAANLDRVHSSLWGKSFALVLGRSAMRFLCVSDIHGHAVALDAVLREARGRGFDQLVVCGDLCFPGPAPLAVWRLLVDHNALCVQGLTDKALVEVDPDRIVATDESERARLVRFREVRDELGEPVLARIARLPPAADFPLESGHMLHIVHGSPVDPTEAITPDLSDDEVSALLGDQSGDIVVCGAGHVSFDREIGDVRVVGVGSVGEAPDGRYAHATLIVSTAADVTAEPIYVEL